jgi:hypothetical protein
MTMGTLGMVLLFATATACGGMDGAAQGDGPARPSGNGTSNPSDGGLASDGGASDGPDGGDGSSCDCSGLALPDICMVCTDGQSACAHFVCEAGVCQTEICQ